MAQKHIVIDARLRQSSTGRYVDRLLEHLQTIDHGNRYTVLVEPDDPWKSRSKQFKPFVCTYRRFSFNPWQQVSFSHYLYKLQPDLVHFAMTGFQPLFYFGRQVTTTHDLTMFKFTRRGKLPKWLHWLRMKGYWLLMWQAHYKAKIIIVPSEYVRDAVAKFHLFTNRKIKVTYEASEPPLKAKAEKPDYISHEDFLLYVGSAFPHKNLRRLIKAFQLVRAKHPALKLLLVGKKEYHARKLERWAENNTMKGVVFAGFVPDSELKWLYENTKAYVFPSLSEGFSLSGLEAMVHGAPVVSSNATCLPEIYQNAAEYFDPENVDDMAEKIQKVLGDEKLREKLVKNGYEVADSYSWQRMAEQTLGVYKNTLGL